MSNFSRHIDDHFVNGAMEREFEANPATRPAQADWDSIMTDARQAAAQSHAAAAFIMQRYNATRQPFALYLRSFEMEAYAYLTPENTTGKRKVITALAGPTPVEEKLTAALSGKLSVLGIANPSQIVAARVLFPRLQLPNEGWQGWVRNLMDHAHLIVMDCTSLAPGILWELQTLRDANRQQDTVIVLPSQAATNPDSLRGVAELLGAETIHYELPRPDSPELQGFPLVTTEDQVDFSNLECCPAFSRLLASACDAIAAAPAFDAAGQARLLNNTGLTRLQQKLYAEALDLFQQASVLQRHIGDRAGLLASLLNLSVVYIDAAQPARSLEPLHEGLALARELRRPADEGLMSSHLGLAHKQLGNFADARTCLIGAYALQTEHGAAEDVENTLTTLSEVFESTGDGDSMVTTLKELRAYHRRRADLPGELRANMRLATTYYQANLLPGAKQLFEECVRLSRETNDEARESVCSAILKQLEQMLASN